MFPIELFQITLEKFTSILQSLDIRFHLTGGLTGTAYGEPRMTQDIDIVIDPLSSQEHVDSIVEQLVVSDFLFAESSVRQAIAGGGMFQLLDEIQCLKLDVYPREMIAGELDRSERLEIFEGKLLPVVSRIDAALSKLIWISKGSHKSRRDLRAIVRKFTPDEFQELQVQATSLQEKLLLDQVLTEADELK